MQRYFNHHKEAIEIDFILTLLNLATEKPCKALLVYETASFASMRG